MLIAAAPPCMSSQGSFAKAAVSQRYSDSSGGAYAEFLDMA